MNAKGQERIMCGDAVVELARMRDEWWEHYKCGCVSESVGRKKGLLGYCPCHGATRCKVFHVRKRLPETATKRKRVKRDG